MFTAYSSYPIELKLGMIILDVSLCGYEQDFQAAEGGAQSFKIFLQTSFLHVPLSRRRRNLLDLKDERSVRSALLFKD